MSVRRSGTAVAILLLVCLVVLGPPRRFEVQGVSMAPGLMPGDVVRSRWFPGRDRFVTPRRFDCWVLRTGDAGGPAGDVPILKRVVGLPGEEVSLVDGDVAVAGRAMLKNPATLARVAVPLDGAAAQGTPRAWERPTGEVLDDVDAPMNQPHELLPVRDVGLAAVIDVTTMPAAGSVRLRAEVDAAVMSWRLRTAGRYGCVAGRLDGHLVAVCWPLPPADPRTSDRSCLPARPPSTWQVARDWPQSKAGQDDVAPRLAIRLDGPPDACLARVTAWRDVLYRPTLNGMASWRPRIGEVVVLGDFPAASRDSRHWGPVAVADLNCRAFHGPHVPKVDYGSSAFTDSPPARVTRAANTRTEMPVSMSRTLQSPSATVAPAAWKAYTSLVPSVP